MNTMKKSMVSVICLLAIPLALGATWTQKRVTYNKGQSMTPAIAVNGPNVYVVWSDNTPGDSEIFFQKSTTGGVTGRPVKGLTSNTGDSEFPDIAVDGTNVYVVWSDDTPGNHEIFFIRSNDSGEHWSSAQRLTDTAGRSSRPRIAVNGPNIYLVWEDKTSGNCDIYFQKSINSGAAWRSAQRLTNNSGDSWLSSLAVSGSNVYLAWTDLTPGTEEIYFRKSTDGGERWETIKRYSDFGDLSWHPEIAAEGSNVYLVWSDYSPGTGDIFFLKSADGGTTWQKVRNITKTEGTTDFGDIAIIGAHIYVVYVDKAYANMEVYINKSTDAGEHWPITHRFRNNRRGIISFPRLAVSDKKVYVVWYGDTSGNFEIYFAYSPL